MGHIVSVRMPPALQPAGSPSEGNGSAMLGVDGLRGVSANSDGASSPTVASGILASGSPGRRRPPQRELHVGLAGLRVRVRSEAETLALEALYSGSAAKLTAFWSSMTHAEYRQPDRASNR